MKTNNRCSLLVFILPAVLVATGILNAKEPFFEGLGGYKHKITTASPQAQRYFDQGLGFYHGFNHGEAIRSFQAAAQLDPKCAMAHWGIALACGPHINLPLVPPPAAELAWKELKLAQENAADASPVERDLIEALGQRYANPQPEDRAPLDQAYADAMRKVWQAHSDDAEVGRALRRGDDGSASVESMDARRPAQSGHRGNSRDARCGAEDRTRSIRSRITSTFTRRKRRRIRRARMRRRIVCEPCSPVSRTTSTCRRTSTSAAAAGRRRSTTNEKAIAADQRYRKIVGPPKGFINVYVAHNQHMLAYAAMMTGQRELAMKHIRAMVAGIDPDFLKEYALQAEGFVAMPMEVMVRFGMWDKILAEPDNYADYMPGTRAFHHAARAIAFAAKGEAENARKEQKTFLEQVEAGAEGGSLRQQHRSGPGRPRPAHD